jgi:nitroimidazol reductase NimA-like FMN-containing flavoprotein (pyridoxamine 5'-phosphate oxidase superfamily)
MAEDGAGVTWTVDDGFDLEGFLSRPLVARVATVGVSGPSVRPVWYLWEERAFWWLTGSWSSLAQLLERDPRVALVVDTCDLERGEVLQVTARGTAELHPFDADRARRWGRRYLGPDERHWRRFQGDVFDDPDTRFVSLEPTTLRARDLSY